MLRFNLFCRTFVFDLAIEGAMQYLEFFMERYGVTGAVLAGVILVLFTVQVCWYAVRYARICRYRNDRRPQRAGAAMPAVSVVVPIFSENAAFLESGLVRLLAQDYDDYEVVAVYVGRDTDFYDDLARMRSSYPNLYTTKIEVRPRYPISVKMALNIGIKSARYEHIIITTADSQPRTNRWVALMAKGFARGETVIGYCGIEPRGGLLDFVERADRMMKSAEWLSAAVAGRPYRGHRCNFGFTKELYFRENGFGNLNMNIGEDDLFMQRIMTPENVSIVLSPRASVSEQMPEGLNYWLRHRRFTASTRELYPARVRRMLLVEPLSRLLLFAAVVAAAIVMPWEFGVAAGVVLLLRYTAVAVTVARLASRLGERKMIAAYPLYDISGVLFDLATAVMLLRKDPSVWRYTSIS